MNTLLDGVATLKPARSGAAIQFDLEFEFDAYISYCDADQEWSEAELIQPLKDAGLKVLHKEEFEAGAFKIEARARAVEHSRRTIVVVTPAWCASEWDTFDLMVTRTRDPKAIYRRLIPLILQECELPSEIEPLVPADFTNPALHREKLAHLLRQLGRTPHEVTEATSGTAKKGIAALAELLRIPSVQNSLRASQRSMGSTSELIPVLGRFKRLHDFFQKADGGYKLLVQSRKMVSAAIETWDSLEESAGELEIALESLLSYALGSGFPPEEVLWTGRVERACAELTQAVVDQDDGKLAGICERLYKVLAGQPTRINDKLVHTAGQLELGAVADELRKVRAAMADYPFAEDAQARLGEFTSGIESLDSLDRSLRVLINNHNCLQEIDDLLRSFEISLRPSPAEIVETWIDLRGPVATLNGDCGALWIEGVRDLARKLDSVTKPLPTEPQAVRELQRTFRDFRDRIDRGFNQTDEDLRRFCDQLQKVGETLASAIGRMQHV
jgi:TIR domain